ncbi:MAG: hypothetical protein AAGA22_01580 [Pseudomonadota bacterium]
MIFRVIGGFAAIFVVILVSLHIVGMREPSAAINKNETVILAALKWSPSADTQSGGSRLPGSLWKGRVAQTLIGAEEPYWDEYHLIEDSDAAIDALRQLGNEATVFAARLELTRLPAVSIGLLRTLNVLGIMSAKEGPLIDDIFETGSRTDILPSNDAIAGLKSLPQSTPLTMVNYLKYKKGSANDAEDGRSAYRRYGLRAMQTVHSVGGQFLFAGQLQDVLIDAPGAPISNEWDDFAAMIYPTPTAILQMEKDPKYREALTYRDEGLDQTIVIATEAF